MELDFFAAFIVGFLGAGHCVGMCGGITTMLTSAIDIKNKTASKLSIILSYNMGRISTYALIGAIAGFTGSLAAKNIGIPVAALKFIAGIFLILLGLYIGQWLMWLTKVEQLGKNVWNILSPLSKNILPVKSAKGALALGAIWGWLPCGLVYSTLTWSIASGSTFNGALIMAAFGLGTLPALLTVSFSVVKLKDMLTNCYYRKFMAICLIFYGIITLKFAYSAMF